MLPLKDDIEGYAASQPEVVRLLTQSIYVDDVVCVSPRWDVSGILSVTDTNGIGH